MQKILKNLKIIYLNHLLFKVSLHHSGSVASPALKKKKKILSLPKTDLNWNAVLATSSAWSNSSGLLCGGTEITSRSDKTNMCRNPNTALTKPLEWHVARKKQKSEISENVWIFSGVFVVHEPKKIKRGGRSEHFSHVTAGSHKAVSWFYFRGIYVTQVRCLPRLDGWKQEEMMQILKTWTLLGERKWFLGKDEAKQPAEKLQTV